jgi:hypothetical protein
MKLRIPEPMETLDPDGPFAFTGREPGVGELAIELFAAGLIIDRDGILEAMAHDAAAAAIAEPARGAVRSVCPVELAHGPTGFTAEIDLVRDDRGYAATYPYLTLFVLAPPDLAVSAGALVTVRSKDLEWQAAADLLASLCLGNNHAANDARGALPVVGRR